MFFIGGVAAFQDGLLVIAAANVVAALTNLAVVLFAGGSSRTMNILANMVNATMALVMAAEAVRAGKNYIQYAWGVALVLFVVMAVRAYRR